MTLVHGRARAQTVDRRAFSFFVPWRQAIPCGIGSFSGGLEETKVEPMTRLTDVQRDWPIQGVGLRGTTLGEEFSGQRKLLVFLRHSG